VNGTLHCRVGTTRVRMGTGGRYLLTKPAVVPASQSDISLTLSGNWLSTQGLSFIARR